MTIVRVCLILTFVVLCTVFLSSCCGPRCKMERQNALFTGGGEDAVTLDLPFEAGYQALCTQGAHGFTSHNATSTMYDVDLDTPNDRDDPVFAPIAGTAYVHDQDPDNGFGIHINIDLGDGTYVILAHLEAAFVDSGSEVAVGQLLGFEGTTGNSFGDHVHFGRHSGDASLDGVYGESFNGLAIDMVEGGDHVLLDTPGMWCDLPDGNVYQSLLDTPLWHPNGSLVKTPDSPDVYLIEHRGLSMFLTEAAFVSYNYDFAEVALISETEKDCYAAGEDIVNVTSITAVYGSGEYAGVWLLIGDDAAPGRYSLKVPSVGWQAVLKSWGIIAVSYDDLVQDSVNGRVSKYAYGGTASFRNGSLVSPISDSAVYVMSDDIAMPIETWETLLFSGWEDRTIIEVDDDQFEAVVRVKGDCHTNTYCYTLEDAQTCGGPDQDEEGINQQIAEGDDLVLTWFMPENREADSITLTGEASRAGQPEEGWGSVFMEVFNVNFITTTVPELRGEDSVRFSVQFREDGLNGWSCTAPYPPGEVQGSLIADYAGTYLPYTPAEDPTSEGCGLKISIP